MEPRLWDFSISPWIRSVLLCLALRVPPKPMRRQIVSVALNLSWTPFRNSSVSNYRSRKPNSTLPSLTTRRNLRRTEYQRQEERDVQLFSAPGKASFYEKLGFQVRSAEAPECH